MTYTVSITSQGQISLPIQIRRKLFKTNKALVSLEKNKVIIEPIQDLMELKGSLQTKIKASPKQIRDAFEKHLSQPRGK
jgi:bifunctional DNA-binding transcriptional regulator/antitoxin component of YhaV-PrlF toxin-antitoxin module